MKERAVFTRAKLFALQADPASTAEFISEATQDMVGTLQQSTVDFRIESLTVTPVPMGPVVQITVLLVARVVPLPMKGRGPTCPSVN